MVVYFYGKNEVRLGRKMGYVIKFIFLFLVC